MDDKPIIKIQKASDFKRCHATGMWGNINPFNELVIHITEDIVDMPEKISLVPDPNNPNSYIEEQIKAINNITRIDHAEITIPMSILPSIINWLQLKLDAYNSTIGSNN